MNSVIPFYEKRDVHGACKKVVMQSTSTWKKVKFILSFQLKL